LVIVLVVFLVPDLEIGEIKNIKLGFRPYDGQEKLNKEGEGFDFIFIEGFASRR
jgi:hypothetical protein